MAEKRGLFVSVEGIEGVGKSTVIAYLKKQLDQLDLQYTLTREPGGTPIAEDVRAVLLKHHEETMAADTELLLMFAGRAQNIQSIIKPALEKGAWVLSDRFTDASFAYQGGGRGVPIQHIEELESWVQGDLKPDAVLLLDTEVDVGLARVQSRGAKDRIEQEGVDFFERARDVYLQRAAADPDRYIIVDATRPADEVCTVAWSRIKALYEAWNA
jgi:dTMP kinase